VLEVVQGQKINPDITVAEMKGDFEQSLQTLFKGKMKDPILTFLEKYEKKLVD